MSRWTHNICEDCWTKRAGDRVPTRLMGDTERCCFCGKENSDGIYLRRDPSDKELRCEGWDNHA